MPYSLVRVNEFLEEYTASIFRIEVKTEQGRSKQSGIQYHISEDSTHQNGME
jgi:hypothetical protein